MLLLALVSLALKLGLKKDLGSWRSRSGTAVWTGLNSLSRLCWLSEWILMIEFDWLNCWPWAAAGWCSLYDL